MSAETDAYFEALAKYSAATDEVRRFVRTVNVIADKLRHPERVAFPNSDSYRRSPTPDIIDNWPDVKEISGALTRWHYAHYALKDIFDKIARTEKEALGLKLPVHELLF